MTERCIRVRGVSRPLTEVEIASLVGSVVATYGEFTYIGGGNDPCCFGKVIRVITPGHNDPSKCPRCEAARRHAIQVEWETGKEVQDESEICEDCVVGIVESGHEFIAFGDERAPREPVQIDITYSLD